MNLKNKNILITGAGKGIGLSTVKFLAKSVFEDNSHAEVYLTSRNEERGLAAVKALKKEGIKKIQFKKNFKGQLMRISRVIFSLQINAITSGNNMCSTL